MNKNEELQKKLSQILLSIEDRQMDWIVAQHNINEIIKEYCKKQKEIILEHKWDIDLEEDNHLDIVETDDIENAKCPLDE